MPKAVTPGTYDWASNKGDFPLNIIDTTFNDLEVGQSSTHRNLSIFPLIQSVERIRAYLTLDEALIDGSATVSEVSEGGSVPELLLRNTGDQPVLLLDGEELVGAKQNRILNLTILAPASQTINIPVSCVEQGRWAYRESFFRSEGRVHFSRGRAAKAASVSQSMRARRSRHSDQSEIWADISSKSASMGVHSETDAMSDIYQNRAKEIDDYCSAFSVQSNQVGAIFYIGGKVAGMDLLETQDVFSRLLPKLVRSYALDAIEEEPASSEKPAKQDAGDFLFQISNASQEEYAAVGLGTDCRLNGANITGGALVLEKRVIHLVAFPTVRTKETRQQLGRMTRASHRRRLH
jgi:hypothetical protein